ncbi:vimentin-type intermediate filament-associated coiled-coil protein-like [Ptychodera flava]|uniref:vimentin-type intermediate filament-associated coiled-coil protein-like n=1 Tax=Ptychodera flava TaxID=63121 RepID=UPI00396A3354
MNFKNFSPSRSSIREANDHLQALYKRVSDLEQTVKDQAESMIKKDEQMQTALKQVSLQKDKEITELRRTLESSEAHVQRLLASQREKDAQIANLQHKCQLLEDICQSKPMLENLLATIEKAENFKTSVSPNISPDRSLSNSPDEQTSDIVQSNIRHFSISDSDPDPSDGGKSS